MQVNPEKTEDQAPKEKEVQQEMLADLVAQVTKVRGGNLEDLVLMVRQANEDQQVQQEDQVVMDNKVSVVYPDRMAALVLQVHREREVNQAKLVHQAAQDQTVNQVLMVLKDLEDLEVRLVQPDHQVT